MTRKKTAQKKEPMVVLQSTVDGFNQDQNSKQNFIPFSKYEPPAGVVPNSIEGERVLAQDSTNYAQLNSLATNYPAFTMYGGFVGYPLLASYAQRAEYRNACSILAEECVRNWITIKTKNVNGKEKSLVDKLTQALEKFHIKDVVRNALLHDGMFGVGRIYIDMGASDKENTKPLPLSNKKIAKGSLKGFNNVEPFWIYAYLYNSIQPLKKDFYKPNAWFCMGKMVDDTRLISVISRPVPDILKPSYNFGGVSLIQLMIEYVDNWTRIRDSVADIVNWFSTSGIKTNMSVEAQKSGQLKRRAELFTHLRKNKGVLLLSQDEDFFQFNVPLNGLDELQSSAIKQLCIPSRIPTLKFTGNPVGGLNASNEGEINIFHETIAGIQEAVVAPVIKKILDIIQLSEVGEINNDIYFQFNPLDELTDKEIAEVELIKSQVVKTQSENDAILTDIGAISAEQAHERLKDDPESPYFGTNFEESLDMPEDASDEAAKIETRYL